MKTQQTDVPVESFLKTVSEQRQQESHTIISIMKKISGEDPRMWGPSIIGFGSQHYEYATGTKGDMPRLAFSPRKPHLTIYFEGFDNYGTELEVLGRHTTSVSCLYIKKLTDIDIQVLRRMLEASYAKSLKQTQAPKR